MREKMMNVAAVFITAVIIVGYLFTLSGGNNNTTDVEDYFVVTNEVYAKSFDTLTDKALNLSYYDFDGLISDAYHAKGNAACTPIEAMDGSTTYDFSFKTKYWQVELFTLMDNEGCTVTSWIDLYSNINEDYYYEYQSMPVPIRPANLVANYSQSGSSRMFQMERQAFANFLVLMRSGGLDQEFGIPFDLAGIPYQKLINIPDPAI